MLATLSTGPPETLDAPTDLGHPNVADLTPVDAARARPWFALATALLAIALILYLPVENVLTRGIQGVAYWIVRLLPDALIVGLALAALVRSRGRLTTYHVLLIVVGLVVGVIVAADVLRGHGPSDSINAARVLVRFAALALVLAACARQLPGLPWAVFGAILVAGLAQVAVGLGQAFAWVLQPAGLLILTGTTGRYDRFGLMVAAAVLALLALLALRPRRWLIVVLLVAMLALYLSTSRQSMLAVAAASLAVLIWPEVRRHVRVVAALVAVAALAMVMMTSNRQDLVPDVGDEVAAPPQVPASPQMTALPGSSPPRSLGGSQLTTNVGGNFRLYLNLELAPWAAAQEPVFGLGPGRHDRLDADPRLIARVRSDGQDWTYLRQFLNDSSYAKLLIQFGVIIPAAFLALLLGSLLVTARAAWRRPDPLGLFAVMFGCVALLTATLGPTFEIRPISAMLWISMFVTIAWREERSAHQATSTRLLGRSWR